MDVKRLDQVAKKLIANLPRREAVKTVAGGISLALAARLGMGGANVEAGNCRNRRRSCNSRGQCCGKKTACREFPAGKCPTLDGRRCCGLEGARCSNDPDKNHCDCCDGLFCGGVTGRGVCQEEPS
jgi:hypothetical protein